MAEARLIIQDEVNVRLTGLDPETLQDVQDRLTFHVPGFIHMPAYKLGRWDGKIALMKKSGKTYLNLIEYILPIIEKNGYELVIDEDDRLEYDEEIQLLKLIDEEYLQGYTLNNKPLTIRDYQIDAVNSALKNGCGLLEMATGSGKSLVAGVLSKLYSEIGRVVVIVPSIDLIIQTQHTFEQIGIDTGVWFGEVKNRKQVTIATWQSLDNFPELFAGVLCVIVDECFSGDTPILTPDGWRNIEDIKPGDSVISYSDDGLFVDDEVVKVHENLPITDNFYELEFEDGTIINVTGNHRFMTTEGYVTAAELTNNHDVISIWDEIGKIQFNENIKRKLLESYRYASSKKEKD